MDSSSDLQLTASDTHAIVLTLVYATYAFGVALSLLLAGRLSDEVGRRPVAPRGLGHGQS